MHLRCFPTQALSFAFLLLSCPLLTAAEAPSETARGDRMLDAYFRHQVQQIADACLADIKSKADWEKKRPELRRQFLEMMGLWPLPPRTDLKPVITGKVETQGFTVEKLYFQSSPGLYVTGNLYVPKQAKWPAPAVLYVCGHGNIVVDKVSYGSKVFYQNHPIWYAEHGFVCLVLDTLELGEIPGTHHGTYRENMWWWQSLGYTPAGVECWNAIRALDYLETRKEVDSHRMGVTGRSGGGATSWWLAAADDRVQCIVPVAGIADLQAHVVEGSALRFPKGVISGHCDCMYFVNTYRWDFPLVAALCAPRPLLLGNSDADEIFPVPGYRRLAEKVRKVYDLYGAADRFTVLETSGPHKDTPELRRGEYRWMSRWLKGETGEVSEKERPPLAPEKLKVLDRVPEDALNPRIQQSFVRAAKLEMPGSAEAASAWWPGKKAELLQELREKVFRGWPEKAPELNIRPVTEVKDNGLRLRAFDFTSEEKIELRLWLLTAEKVENPKRIKVLALDETSWQEWQELLPKSFRHALQTPPNVKNGEGGFGLILLILKKEMASKQVSIALLAPRGIGPTRWAEAGTPADVHIKRRFPLLGQTLDGQRVWDVRRGLAVLRGLPDLKDVPLWLEGKGDMAGVALYAALFEPDVAGLHLYHLPASHAEGPIFLNVRRFLDLPQALALAFPRPIYLHVEDEAEARPWDWPLKLQQELRGEYLKIEMFGK